LDEALHLTHSTLQFYFHYFRNILFACCCSTLKLAKDLTVWAGCERLLDSLLRLMDGGILTGGRRLS
jgi:hypothetical protein